MKINIVPPPPDYQQGIDNLISNITVREQVISMLNNYDNLQYSNLCSFNRIYNTFNDIFDAFKNKIITYNKNPNVCSETLLKLNKYVSIIIKYKQDADKILLEIIKNLNNQQNVRIELDLLIKTYQVEDNINLNENTELITKLKYFVKTIDLIDKKINDIDEKFIIIQNSINDINKLIGKG